MFRLVHFLSAASAIGFAWTVTYFRKSKKEK